MHTYECAVRNGSSRNWLRIENSGIRLLAALHFQIWLPQSYRDVISYRGESIHSSAMGPCEHSTKPSGSTNGG